MGAPQRTQVGGRRSSANPSPRSQLRQALLFLTHQLAENPAEEPGTEGDGLSPLQMRALIVLDRSEQGLGMDELGLRLRLSPPSVSRLCQRMERDALLVRQSGPGRSITVSLSARGSERLATVDAAGVEQLRQLLGSMPTSLRHVLAAELTASRPKGGRRDVPKRETVHG